MLVNRKIRVNAPFDMDIIEEDLRAPAGNERLIRNRYSLISPGTELAVYTGTHIMVKDDRAGCGLFPFFPGYAAIGQLEPGGELVYHTGHHETGRLVQPGADLTVPVPAAGDPKQYLFSRFAQIADTAIIKTTGKPERVLVLGAGIIGNLAAQLYACKMGSAVILCDILDERLERARACGIGRTVNSAAEDLEQKLEAYTGGAGVDCVVEATGNAKLAAAALKLVRVNGQVILLGSPRERLTLDLYREIHCRGISLTGAHETVPDSMPGLAGKADRLKEMMGLISRGRLNVVPLISNTCAPDRIREAYEGLLNHKARYYGVVLDWN